MKNRVNPFAEAEQAHETRLPKKHYGIVRVDGKAFHTFTKQFERPFSTAFAYAMDETARHLCTVLSGVRFAYVQSDEISVVFSDRKQETSQYPFDGRTAKIASITASNATAAFMQHAPHIQGFPIFDGRVFALPEWEQVIEYLDYRRRDARKNAVSMAAEAHYSHHFLMGKSTLQRMDYLELKGIHRLPDEFFHGRLILPVYEDVEHSYVDKRTGIHQVVFAKRKRWETTVATREAVDALTA